MRQIEKLLERASEQEKQALAELVEAKSSSTEHIIRAIRGQSYSIRNFLTMPTYHSIVREVARKLEISREKYEPAREVEIKIAQKVIKTVWEQMTPEQRLEIERELREAAKIHKNQGVMLESATVFGTLTAAQLSGFSIYLLSSTALGAVTSTLGITLPFAAYTAMSSAISVVVGPVGWMCASVGVFALWRIKSENKNHQRLVSAILYISALRVKLDGQFE